MDRTASSHPYRLHARWRAVDDLWRAVGIVLVATLTWTSAGLLIGGDRVLDTDAFEVARAWPGGTAALGAIGLLLALMTCWAWGRGPRTLTRVLPLVVTWHATWVLMIAAAWLTAGATAWTALGNHLALAALWTVLALTIPARGARGVR